jgi:molecular chaperone DnaJ
MAEAFFGRGFSRGRHSRSRRGEDLRVLVSVSLEEVLRGTKREIKISHKVVCKECGGSGTPSGAKEISCPGCQGRGQRRTVRSTLFGTLQTISTCPECGGTGTKITAQCGKCSGEGRLDATETIEIEIPPGVSDGGGFVIEDKGNAGIAGGTHGNLVVFIKETPHKVFSRNAGELHYRLPITFSQAALGDIIEIPTLDGKIHQLKIPEGTQFGQNFRLRGMGLPSVESRSRGDLVVTTFIITPQKLSKDEKEYFEKLKEIEKGKPVELPNPDENILEKLWELFNK